jgi:hypothetical protein
MTATVQAALGLAAPAPAPAPLHSKPAAHAPPAAALRRCLRLADDRDEEARAVKRLLAHRLSGEDSTTAKLEWYSIVEGAQLLSLRLQGQLLQGQLLQRLWQLRMRMRMRMRLLLRMLLLRLRLLMTGDCCCCGSGNCRCGCRCG